MVRRRPCGGSRLGGRRLHTDLAARWADRWRLGRRRKPSRGGPRRAGRRTARRRVGSLFEAGSDGPAIVDAPGDSAVESGPTGQIASGLSAPRALAVLRPLSTGREHVGPSRVSSPHPGMRRIPQPGQQPVVRHGHSRHGELPPLRNVRHVSARRWLPDPGAGTFECATLACSAPQARRRSRRLQAPSSASPPTVPTPTGPTSATGRFSRAPSPVAAAIRRFSRAESHRPGTAWRLTRRTSTSSGTPTGTSTRARRPAARGNASKLAGGLSGPYGPRDRLGQRVLHLLRPRTTRGPPGRSTVARSAGVRVRRTSSRRGRPCRRSAQADANWVYWTNYGGGSARRARSRTARGADADRRRRSSRPRRAARSDRDRHDVRVLVENTDAGQVMKIAKP